MRTSRPRLSPTAALLAAVGLLATPVLAACESTNDTAGSTSVTVTAGDTACQTSTATVPAGATRFEAKNTGSQVTEVYVYRPDGSIAAEKENIGPGTSAAFTAQLDAGAYVVACKPGQKGDGIRTPLTVS